MKKSFLGLWVAAAFLVVGVQGAFANEPVQSQAAPEVKAEHKVEKKVKKGKKGKKAVKKEEKKESSSPAQPAAH